MIEDNIGKIGGLWVRGSLGGPGEETRYYSSCQQWPPGMLKAAREVERGDQRSKNWEDPQRWQMPTSPLSVEPGPGGQKVGYTPGLWVPSLEFFPLHSVIFLTQTASSQRRRENIAFGTSSMWKPLSAPTPRSPPHYLPVPLLCHPLLLHPSLLYVFLKRLLGVELTLRSGASLIPGAPSVNMPVIVPSRCHWVAMRIK